MDKLKILIIEDDKLAQKVMSSHLTEHEVAFAGDKETATTKLHQNNYDLCFIDLMLSENDNYSGLKLLSTAVSKGIYSVVVSSCDTDDIVTRAYELGCHDFYAKGNEETNIHTILSKYIQNRKNINKDNLFSSQFITEDSVTRANILEALKYAPTALPILILGPSGSGKTSLAKIIHDHSHREGAFVAINCSAYPEDLLEAELFGYKKGAFTGAVENRKGKLAQANGGTLFLDEIGTMSPNMQMKLLKAIEEQSFYPVGSNAPEISDFRIISATLENLHQLLAQNKLRFDFFQRIHGYTVALKPLAQRRCDILPLITFLTKKEKKLSFTPEAKEFLFNHDWPGNIRELKKFLELISSGCDGRITLEQVKRHITQAIHKIPDSEFLTQHQYTYALENGLDEALDHFAYEIIKRNLEANNGKKVKTLNALKISTRLFYSTLRKHDELKKEKNSHDTTK